MAITSWPFDGQSVSETQFSQWANMLRTSGVMGSADFTVSPSSGLVLAVAAGLALVRGHAVNLDANTTVTIATADANPRIDIVVLRLDPTANSITLAIVKGTAAASPVPPTLTQTTSGNYELPLAQIAVAAGTVVINSGDITDQRVQLHSLLDADDISDATATGKALIRAANAAAARTAVGATAVGSALLQASSVIAARETIRLFKGDGPVSPSVDDLRYRDA